MPAKEQPAELLPLFLYGTLRRGAPNPWSRRLWADAVYLGEGSIRGRLYSLGSYPGMVESQESGDQVWGQVIRPADEGHLLPALDLYEGELFERVKKKAVLESGEAVQVWAWVYRGEVAEADRMSQGRFEPL